MKEIENSCTEWQSVLNINFHCDLNDLSILLCAVFVLFLDSINTFSRRICFAPISLVYQCCLVLQGSIYQTGIHRAIKAEIM